MVVDVSVVIPTYNRANIISRTINSVLNQTFQNFEIVIIDDGSSDDTEQIIKKFNDERVKYIKQQNSGPSNARNNGIKKAEGRYIAFLDSDDEWLPQKLEKQVCFLEKHSAISILGCWNSNISPDGKKFDSLMPEIKNSKEFIKGLTLFPFHIAEIPWTSSIIARKECFYDAGFFDEDLLSREDWDMWFRIAVKFEFYCLPEILINRNISASGLMNTTDADIIIDNNSRFLDKVFSNQYLKEEFQKYKKPAYANLYLTTGNFLLYSQAKPGKARGCYFKSLKYSLNNILRPSFFISFGLSFMPIFIIKAFEIFKKQIKNLLGKEKLF